MMKFSLCQFCYWIEVLRTGRESNWWSKHEVFWQTDINVVKICVNSIFNLFWFQCKMYWQQKGDYLGVKVDRYTKSKKVSICTCNFILIKCTSRPSNLGVEYSLTWTVYSVVVLWYEGCFPLTHSECVVLNHLTPRTDQ